MSINSDSWCHRVSYCPSSSSAPCRSPVCRPDPGRACLARVHVRACVSTCACVRSMPCGVLWLQLCRPGLSRPRTGLCLPEKPIRFTEFHDHRQALGISQPASWQRLYMLLVPGVLASGWLDLASSSPGLRHRVETSAQRMLGQ